MLQSQQPKPLYLQLQDDIKQGIRFKEYKPGDRMLSENELCEKYGVSRITVRRAIQGLVDMGLLEKQRGKGTFVSVPKSNVPVGYHGGFSPSSEGEDHRTERRILEKAFRSATARQADMLSIKEGDPIIYVKRLMLEDGFPLAIDDLCVSAQRFPELMDQLESNVSFYGLLENLYHVTFGGSQFTLDVSTAKFDEAQLLCCAAGDPLFILHKQLLDADGLPIHYSKSRLRGDRTTYCFKTGSNDQILFFQSKESQPD